MADDIHFVPILGNGKAPFRAVIAISRSDTGSPFVRIGRQTLWGRRLRAGVVSSSEVMVEDCVLFMPSDDPGDSTGGELERRWAVLHQMLLAARPRDRRPCFPDLLLPGDGDVATLPPTVYCAQPEALFELPCPSCLKPLATCTDDALLASAKLPLYSGSSTRFLYCPLCASGEGPATLIDPAANELNAADGVTVMTNLDYLNAVADAIATHDKPKRSIGFRCLGCAEQEQCWQWSAQEEALELDGLETAAAASQGPRWRVLSTHTSPYLLTRPVAVPFETFVHRLGSESTRQREEEASAVTSLLFTADGSGMDAVEILTLKLTAIAQALSAVGEHHRLFGRAHLDLNSDSLVVADGDATPGLPSLWSFQVRLEPTSAVDTLELGPGITVALPPPDPVAPFFPPSIRDFMLTDHRVGEFVVERLTESGDGGWRMEGQLVDPRGVFPRPRAADWVRVRWVEDPVGLEVTETAARPDPRAKGKAAGKAVAITTEPLAIDAAVVEKIKRARGVQFPNVSYRVYPRFGARDDIYSLGMLLFLSVLVNDSQDLGLVIDDLTLLGLQAVEHDAWKDLARQQAVEHPETWGPNAVFFDVADRAPGRPNAIPDVLWSEVLALALRMVAPASDLVESEQDEPELLAAIQAEVGAIVRRLRSLLFDRQPFNLEMQSVIEEILSMPQEGS